MIKEAIRTIYPEEKCTVSSKKSVPKLKLSLSSIGDTRIKPLKPKNSGEKVRQHALWACTQCEYEAPSHKVRRHIGFKHPDVPIKETYDGSKGQHKYMKRL